MKFATPIIATFLLAVASVQATGLIRGNAKQDAEALKEAEFGTATIILSHVSTPGKWSNKIISDSFKQAYNDVHTGEGAPYIDWTFVDTELEVPEDGNSAIPGTGRYWESNSWVRFKYTCPDCTPMDKKSKKILPPVMLGALEYPDLHSQFESTFCKLIANADPTSFAEVTKCQIDFTYSLSDANKLRHVKTADEDSFRGEMRGELDISHVLKSIDDSSLNENRMVVIGNCLKDTYNMVHADSPYSLIDYTLERQIDTPEDDDDEDALTTPNLKKITSSARTWNWFHTVYTCRWCSDDDRKFVPPLAMSRLTMGEHQAFEATFANCLRESGVAAFAKVRNPHIRFTYTGNQETA
ncbi:hypothetical protein MPSEU_001084500 [Mayamaea pseudoterrestris]|nr:hypothetical protein MPSEU_001084500 [Mayamaea pseudoterrestris]